MDIKLNKEGDGEISFSWKEIWTLIKNKKFIINEDFLDAFTTTLVNLKIQLVEQRKKEQEEKQKKDVK